MSRLVATLVAALLAMAAPMQRARADTPANSTANSTSRAGSAATSNATTKASGAGQTPVVRTIDRIELPSTLPLFVTAGAPAAEMRSVFMLTVPDEFVGKSLTLTDRPIGALDANSVSVSYALQPGSTGLEKDRFYVATVRGLKLGFASLGRKLELKVQGVPDVHYADVSFAETNAAAGRFTPLAIPSEITWDDAKKGVPIQIDVQSSQVTGLAVVGRPFQDEANKRLLTSALKLCATPDAQCSPAKTLIGPGVHDLFLVVGDTAPAAGVYKRDIQFRADGSTATTAVPLTITVTYANLKVLGCLLLALGVFIAFILAQVLPNRVAQLDAQRPLAILSDQVDKLIERAQQYPKALGAMPRFQTALAKANADRTQAAFRNVAGWRGWTARFIEDANTGPQLIKAFIDSLGVRVTTLDLLVEHGLAQIEPIFADQRPDAVTALTKAAADLDKLAPDAAQPAIAPADLTKAADGVVTTLTGAIAAIPALLALALNVPPVPRKLSVERIDYELRNLNGLGWAIWTVLTVAIGTWTLVIGKASFGSATDFLVCFVWGFGLPTANTTLAALTPAAIRSTLQVPASK